MQSALENAQKWGATCTTPVPIALIPVPIPYSTRPGTNVIAICVPENTPVSQKSIRGTLFPTRSRTIPAPCPRTQRSACVSSFCNTRVTSTVLIETRFPQMSPTQRPFAKTTSFYLDHELFTKTKSHR